MLFLFFSVLIGKWIILLLIFMSLTLARSEREQSLLTHANLIELGL